MVAKVFVVSPTEVTFTVNPAASDPAEAVCLQVGGTVEVGVRRNSSSRARRASPPVAVPNATGTGGCAGVPVYQGIAYATAYVGCPPPTITSINPNIWYPGQSASATVQGTGFITAANASLACPVTTVTATATDGSAVTASNVNVNNPTLLVASVEPASAAPTEAATLTVSGAAAPSPNADVLGAPIIYLSNKPISGPGAIQPTPVVGQSLPLTTTPTVATLAALPIPLTVESSTWPVTGGTNIGGYTPTAASYATGSVTPMPPLNELGLSFYSVYPEASVAETYTLCTHPPPGVGALACNPLASASFEVSGPGNAPMTTNAESALTISMLIAIPPCLPTSADELPYLVYGTVTGYDDTDCPGSGGESGTPGITFAPPAASPNGTYSFVQLITGDTTTYTEGTKGSITCPTTPGLDGQYPYPPVAGQDYTGDAPDVQLQPYYSKVARTFGATMYLLWTSDLSSSIPVPIGYQEWYFQTATTNASYSTGQAWSTPTSIYVGANGGFVLSATLTSSETTPYGYPIWSGLAAPVAAPNCPTSNSDADGVQQEERQ
jgi:hypothetical protein